MYQHRHESGRQYEAGTHRHRPDRHVSHGPVDVGLYVKTVAVTQDHGHRIDAEECPLGADESDGIAHQGHLSQVTEAVDDLLGDSTQRLGAVQQWWPEFSARELKTKCHRNREEYRRDAEDDRVGMVHWHVASSNHSNGGRDDGTNHESQGTNRRHDRGSRQVVAFVDGVLQPCHQRREKEAVEAHCNEQSDEQGQVRGSVACTGPDQDPQPDRDEAAQAVGVDEDSLT